MCEKTHGRTAKVSQRRQPDAFPGGIWAVNRHMGRHPDWERPKLRRCERSPTQSKSRAGGVTFMQPGLRENGTALFSKAEIKTLACVALPDPAAGRSCGQSC